MSMLHTKRAVLKESIDRINKRIVKIKEITEAKPVSRICEIRIEAQKRIKECTDYTKLNIDDLYEEEKKMFKLARKQQKEGTKLWDELFDLETELQELITEQYYTELKVAPREK